jgi:isomerase DpgB
VSGETAAGAGGCELTGLPDGLGHRLAVPGRADLPALTEAVGALADLVSDRADRNDRTVFVVELGPGGDLDREWPGPVTIQQVNRWERAVRRLGRLPAAGVGTLDGTCGGPALELALATDFRICTPGLRLLLPVNDGHFWPGMAVHRLVQQVGPARARQLVMWSGDVTAEWAVGAGLVDRVTDDLGTAVHEAAALLGRVSDAELAIRRQLLEEALCTTPEEALGGHLAACDRELRRLAAAPARATSGTGAR